MPDKNRRSEICQTKIATRFLDKNGRSDKNGWSDENRQLKILLFYSQEENSWIDKLRYR